MAITINIKPKIKFISMKLKNQISFCFQISACLHPILIQILIRFYQRFMTICGPLAEVSHVDSAKFVCAIIVLVEVKCTICRISKIALQFLKIVCMFSKNNKAIFGVHVFIPESLIQSRNVLFQKTTCYMNIIKNGEENSILQYVDERTCETSEHRHVT